MYRGSRNAELIIKSQYLAICAVSRRRHLVVWSGCQDSDDAEEQHQHLEHEGRCRFHRRCFAAITTPLDEWIADRDSWQNAENILSHISCLTSAAAAACTWTQHLQTVQVLCRSFEFDCACNIVLL